MRIILDATPLLGRRTGVGRYVEHLAAELPDALSRRGQDGQVRLSTWSARGGRIPDPPKGTSQVGVRTPARLVRGLWRRWDAPPVELLVGRADVFHGTNFVSPPTRRAREVVTVHDLTYETHAATVSRETLAYRELVPRALRRGAHVVTPTEAVAEAVRDLYHLPDSRVTATPLGVEPAWSDAAPLDATRLAAMGVHGHYVVFVGSLDPRKNLPGLLRAHALARSRDAALPDLVLAGPAGRETTLGAQPGVHLTGWLRDEELRGLVAGSRALVLPSFDEGFGLPALEALATGRAVLVSDLPVLREVTGPWGDTVDPNSTESLAEGLARAVRAAEDEPTRSGRREWAARFTWARTADRTVAVYEAVTS